MTYLIPPDGTDNRAIVPADRICSLSQEAPNQTFGNPLLRAKAGDTVVLRYQENGHITLPQNNPPGKSDVGMVYIYGTGSSSPADTVAAIHMVWNSLGTGGDRRGQLLAARSFDDGRCYQINDGPISKARQALFPHAPDPVQGENLWCDIAVVLPKDLESESLFTVFWVWDWSTRRGPNAPRFQIYTTCSDIQIM